MGILDMFKKIQVPETGNLAIEAKQLKTQFRKTDINTVSVRYFFKNTPYFMDTVATLHRTTNFTIGIIEIPEALGFILADDSIYFDKTSKKEIIHIKEGYPFSLNLSLELKRELEDFKTEHTQIKEYMVPIMINQIPMRVIRIKLNHKLPDFPNEMDITQKMIHQLAFTKIMDKVNKPKIQGAFMLVVMGFLAGALFGLSMGVFFMG